MFSFSSVFRRLFLRAFDFWEGICHEIELGFPYVSMMGVWPTDQPWWVDNWMYPLGNIQKRFDQSPNAIFMGKSTISTGPFSIAFCLFARPGISWDSCWPRVFREVNQKRFTGSFLYCTMGAVLYLGLNQPHKWMCNLKNIPAFSLVNFSVIRLHGYFSTIGVNKCRYYTR